MILSVSDLQKIQSSAVLKDLKKLKNTMSQANMTAGLVGKFGQSTFTSVSKLG